MTALFWQLMTNLAEPQRELHRLLIVLVLGLFVRLIFLYTTKDVRLMIVDEQHYHVLALNLLHGHGLAWGPGTPTSLRPPLYPAFVAFVWWITDTESVSAVRMAQLLLSLLNTFALYQLGALLFDRRTALLAAAGFCFYPSLLAFNFLMLTEVLFTFLLTLVVLGYVILLRTGNGWAACGTGVGLGLAVLTRSVLWLFPVIFFPFVFFTMPGNRRKRLLAALLLFLGYFLVVIPWAVRNTKLQGVLTAVDTMGGLTLRMGNYDHTDLARPWDPSSIEGEKSIFQELHHDYPDSRFWTEGQKEKWALKKALAYMVDHPQLTLKRAVVKFARFWGLERVVIAGWQQELYQPPRWFVLAGTLIIAFSCLSVMLLACLGIFLAPPADRRVHVFLLLLMGFIVGIHTVTFGHERYHLPLMPFLLLYAAAVIERRSWIQLCNVRQAAAPILACISLFVIWGWEVLIVEVDRIRVLVHTFLG